MNSPATKPERHIQAGSNAMPGSAIWGNKSPAVGLLCLPGRQGVPLHFSKRTLRGPVRWKTRSPNQVNVSEQSIRTDRFRHDIIAALDYIGGAIVRKSSPRVA